VIIIKEEQFDENEEVDENDPFVARNKNDNSGHEKSGTKVPALQKFPVAKNSDFPIVEKKTTSTSNVDGILDEEE